MKYESDILKRLIKTYGVVGNPRYISEIIKEFIVRGKDRFPNLFTYQADWLAHIDEFGLNPTYTVSYTGQSIYAPNTLEKPVKSAILKGQTLVNIVGDVHDINRTDIREFYLKKVKANTDYIISYNAVSNNESVTSLAVGFLNDSSQWSNNNENSPLNGKFILNSGPNPCYFRLNGKIGYSILTVSNVMVIEYQEGMENWDIPYFEGMQSVKMPVLTTTGKNLFDGEWKDGYGIANDGIDYSNPNQSCTNNFVLVKPSTKYKYSNTNTTMWIKEYDENKELIKFTNFTSTYFITQPNTRYVRFEVALIDKDKVNMLVEGDVLDDYEPYKSNILTVNEDVELRGIGDVKDELNLLTGELTQRIGEVVFDGSDDENWVSYTGFGGLTYFRIAVNDMVQIDDTDTTFIFDKIKVCRYSYIYNATSIPEEMIGATTLSGGLKSQAIYIYYKNIGDVNTFKTYLQSNPITVQYQLATPTIKTVDLNILDQNGENVKQLMSFNGGTHFNTGSLEGSPLPSLEVSVETDLEETLAVCSLDGNTM